LNRGYDWLKWNVLKYTDLSKGLGNSIQSVGQNRVVEALEFGYNNTLRIKMLYNLPGSIVYAMLAGNQLRKIVTRTRGSTLAADIKTAFGDYSVH